MPVRSEPSRPDDPEPREPRSRPEDPDPRELPSWPDDPRSDDPRDEEFEDESDNESEDDERDELGDGPSEAPPRRRFRRARLRPPDERDVVSDDGPVVASVSRPRVDA